MEHSNHWIANDGTIKILNDFKVKSFSKAFSVHRYTEDETISEQHEDTLGSVKYRVYKKKRNLGISQEIDIVLKTKDFRRLGI